MRFLRNCFSAAAVAIAMLSMYGCLALMVPSLAYEGYKYEKSSKQNSQPASSSSKSKQPSSSHPISDDDIE